ncbi:hypothetical protein GCM10010497_58420 [Streptomyces cinereoruber]|uniref:Uncharacterized protein n=1 Tax=Streptomyces cinereoruber TaxID=67260 RepID=A0AAV4KR73_9ACTN|nr:hypothetical protein [Streptomyces cinereoruber]MBB4161805.1 hypothetical protein [Streptomyces cinereoruber]NIH65490.1 hypothetical protein [Streptomyces cinereoruber]QEV30813.1 hypothetical protein CP977_00070 [Streptomyces cinereoruber]GGR47406.1 hypothetical protein GCM10010497_58420 [Streptomyces cinereoruber]
MTKGQVNLAQTPTTQTWTHLAPHITDIPKTSPHPGRAHAVQGTDARPLQVLYLTHTEAAPQAANAVTAAEAS